jgi:hypothetical protein
MREPQNWLFGALLKNKNAENRFRHDFKVKVEYSKFIFSCVLDLLGPSNF